MGKYTDADVKRIANAMRRQRDDKPDRPYSLLMGAGCSKSAGIPLSHELVEEIKEKYKLEIEHRLGKDCDDDYGRCMSALSSNEVKDIIQPHLDTAGVNWGHLAIASLMKAGYVGRVLTFNFDSILARSCGLLGEYPATYDFVSSVSTRTDHIAQQAILHLHGQGHSLAILNSADETREHAENLRPLLVETFSKTPIIVAGYSGKSDAVFDVIKDIYNGAERLHWTDLSEDYGPHITELLQTRPNTSEYLGGADSDIFFKDIAIELGCWPPELFVNPYSHLLKALEPIVEYPGSDRDILSAIKAELVVKAEESEKSEDDANDLIIKGDWDAVERLLGPSPTDENSKSLLAIALRAKADILCNHGWTNGCAPDELEESHSLFQRAYELDNEFDYLKLNNWGNVLFALARLNAAPDLFRKSFQKYAEVICIKPDFHGAFANWGNALSGLAKLEEDMELFQEGFKKYAEATHIEPDNHHTLNNWGGALTELYHLTDEAAYLEEAAEKIQIATEGNPDDLYNLACLRVLQGDVEAAKAAFLHCETKDTLPERSHLEADATLESLRELDWFKALLERIT